MPTAVVSGFLDINSGGAPFDDLALKVYAGLVLESFNMETTTEGRHTMRTISSGKSAQFPAIGRVGHNQHTRGEHITYLQVNSNEVVIPIHDILMSPIFIDILDEAKSHFDVRAPYATQQGQELAELVDLRVLASFATGGRSAALITGGDGGSEIIDASMKTDAAIFKGAVYDAAEDMDDRFIPSSERYLWVAPAQYYLLLQDGEFIDRDFNDGGNGSKATAVMRSASDFTVVKTSNLPSTDLSADTTLPSNIRGDFSNLAAVAGHPRGAGSVTLMGIQFESQYDMDRQGHMLIAKFAKGFDALQREACVAFSTS